MTVENRQRIEREIVTAVVQAAHEQGFTFMINNGGDDDEEIATSGIEETLKEMFATDEERLFLVKDGRWFGWVLFVYGNDGWDVISDYTTKLDDIGLLKNAEKISEKYS